MTEQTLITNELNGSASDGPVLQAATVTGGVTLNSAKQVIHRGLSLSIATNLFRFSVSLLGCTAVYGVSQRLRPLTAATNLCTFLGLPTDWLVATAHWLSERADILSVTAWALVVFGTLAMPKPQSLHGDLGNIVKWRSPFTVLLGLALIMQCGTSLWDLVSVGTCLVLWLWTVGRGAESGTRGAYLAVAVIGIALAILYLPLLTTAWLLSRDADREP